MITLPRNNETQHAAPEGMAALMRHMLLRAVAEVAMHVMCCVH